MKRKGFTLVELLIVVAIIALLMSILMPILSKVKRHASAAVCMHNLKTLSRGWFMYKDANDDKLVGGHVGGPPNWVRGPSGPSSDPIEQKKEGIRQGLLFEYVGKSVDVYRCPSDGRKLTPGQAAFRSYSIAGGLNGEGWQNTYVQAKVYGDIKNPAGKYVFVEESDPRGWNVGSWVLNPKTKTWVDPLAIWHHRKSTLGFADGHAEARKWVDESTIEMSEKQIFYHPVPVGEGEDIDFMLRGFPYKSLQ